eukprot:15366167-Ditylum_brightwellii.AAC.1
MAIPPFIANSLSSSPSMSSSSVLVHCRATVNSFDLKYKDQGFPSVEKEGKDLIQFLWTAKKGKIPHVSFMDSSYAFN